MTTSLQTIILYNFKSYKGKIIIGPFRDSFMTIVGRNGSGKSNIVDAIQFVCGETISNLGVKRLSELVYANIKSPKESYVTVIFQINDNKEKSFTKLIQEEDSQYLIDNEIVTSDVYMTALWKYGLDIRSENFLVSQGYIECIAIKTPKELNAMFEQICGSNVYKAIYKRLKTKLAQAETEVQLVQNMKKQLLMNKKFAIMEREMMEEYLQLQEQYKKEKLQYELRRLFLIKNVVKTLQDKDKNIKLRIENYLRSKREAMLVLKNEKLEFKRFADSLEGVVQNVSRLENVIQRKKAEYTVLEENIAYWQKKRNCAHVSVENARLARNTNKRTIEELNNELNRVDNKLAEFMTVSQQSAAELSNSQVKQYYELKNTIGCQAKDFVKKIDNFTRDQQADCNRLDNENRQKEELKDKMKQTAIMKESLKTRIEKLQSVINESKTAIGEKEMKRQELNDKIVETNNKSSLLRENIAKIVEKLQEIDIDNYIINEQAKKAEIIKTLKKSFCGVYDRVSNLCRPVHSRYNIAITKAFGKSMDAIVVDTMKTAMQCTQFLKQHKVGVETFLPLDSLKPVTVKEKLRDIREPNVKLLYDVVQISKPEISKAILFITKNTLICETPDDARRVAYEIDRHTHDCVSLDGVFYRKNGTFSGGLADLMIRTKQWEGQYIIALNEQKEKLKKELNDLPNISLLQSELNVVDLEHKGLSLKNKLIEAGIKGIKAHCMKVCEESTKHDAELSLLNETISKIKRDMQTRDIELEKVKRNVSAIEDSLFADFCRDINVPNIDYYEKNYLWAYQEQQKSQMELEKQRDLIQNQLHFETKRDTEDKILKWTSIMEQADAKLNEIHGQANFTKSVIEENEKELSKLQKDWTNAKKKLADVENRIVQCEAQIDVISESYLNAQKMHISIQRNIERQKVECDVILKECKIEDITIPMLSERSSCRPSSSSSSSVTDSSIDWDVSSKIDFSKFSINISNNTEENLRDLEQLNKKLTKIQKELEAIVNPNFKAQENVDSMQQQIQEINKEFKRLYKNTNEIRKRFETVKMKRYNLMSECLERVAAEIDPIYKSLVSSHASMCAFILPDNPEEPYEGGINYSCMIPSKHFQLLQNLSGGEKTFASLALLFALQRYKPTPFFVMDESDAALDNVNIKRIVRFIKSQMNTMKFLIVSHRESLYRYSDTLIGVTTELDAEYIQSNVFAISLRDYKE